MPCPLEGAVDCSLLFWAPHLIVVQETTFIMKREGRNDHMGVQVSWELWAIPPVRKPTPTQYLTISPRQRIALFTGCTLTSTRGPNLEARMRETETGGVEEGMVRGGKPHGKKLRIEHNEAVIQKGKKKAPWEAVTPVGRLLIRRRDQWTFSLAEMGRGVIGEWERREERMLEIEWEDALSWVTGRECGVEVGTDFRGAAMDSQGCGLIGLTSLWATEAKEGVEGGGLGAWTGVETLGGEARGGGVGLGLINLVGVSAGGFIEGGLHSIGEEVRRVDRFSREFALEGKEENGVLVIFCDDRTAVDQGVDDMKEELRFLALGGGGEEMVVWRLALQSFMGQWNIGVNGPNDNDDHIFGQIASDFL
ncbi:hypothetical protein EDB85DRAFT_1899175 [Lactarius pseudohatsudake]|nr:hypothetical protein EDB85DRAFT_1899175 [Lactarius pseudohatsudake]